MGFLLKKCFAELERWIVFLLFNLPGSTGMLARSRFLQSRCKRCGTRIRIDTGVCITGLDNIEIGDNVSIMRNCSVHADTGKLSIGSNFSMNANSTIDANGGEIQIGDNVLVAQNVVLRAADHNFERLDKPAIEQGHKSGRIVVGYDCWIAANVVVTRNVTIREHSIVGAGAVVTKNVEPFSIVGGVPARLIKTRR